MKRGYDASESAVRFLGKWIHHVATAQAGFYMRDRDFAMECCQSSSHRGCRISLDHEAVNWVYCQHRIHCLEHATGKAIQRLVCLHQVEVNGRLDPEDLHHLIEHGAMLRRGNEIRFEFFRMPLQLCDDWSEFDGLRPGAKYHSHL